MHAHHAQQAVYNAFEIDRLLWPGNSPDLNMIEPAWPYLKRRTTSRGAPRTCKDMEVKWLKGWKDLPQAKIQAWIERIPRHLERIRELKGGNEYREGREDKDSRKWKGKRMKGKLSVREDLSPQESEWEDE